MKLTDIKPNKDNPRLIKDDRFKKLVQSIKDFPAMMFTCHTCGIEFTSKKADKNHTPKYCSRECYGKSILKLRPCPVCNKSFPSYPKTKYCSDECRLIGTPSRKGLKLSDEWKKALSEGRKRSEKCKGENLYNWRGGLKHRMEYNLQKYHERRANGKIDKLYLKVLYILQGKSCYYCGKDISGKKRKAIEHLIPVSQGGDNTWMNLVYACQKCNSKKHSSTLADFAIKELRPDWLNNMVQFRAKEIRDRICN